MVTNLGKYEREGEGTAEYPPGAVLAERYRIISTAGRGGMGLVYKVEQIFINKILALKTIDRRDLSDIAVRRFQHEARATFAVSHPNIVCVHDFGLLNDTTPFLAMDFVDGETLSQVIARSGSGVPVEQAIPIFIQVCFGLAAAHDVGIVHRDLKPSNIIVVKDAVIGSEGSVKVVDFGIAKLTQHDGGEIQALTRTGEIFGSPLYMSPEQCKSGRVDHRSDVYSLGCVLFEALTGAPPFIGDSALTTMMQHQGENAPTLKQASLGTEFSPRLEAILAKMLAKDPNDRYQNLGFVAHALASVLGSKSVVAPEPPAPKKAEKKTIAATNTVSISWPTLVLLLTFVAAAFAVGGYLLGTHNAGRVRQTVTAISPTTESAEQATAHNPSDGALIQETGKQFFPPDDDALKDLKSKLQHPSADGELALMGVTLSSSIMKEIADTKWITSAKLNYCTFDNQSFELLAKKPNLDSLFVSDSNFNDVGATQISRCRSLVRLEAARSAITDAGVVQFARLNRLNNVQLSETHVTDRGVAALANNPGLEVVRLVRCKQITNTVFAPFMHSRVTTIDLKQNGQIGDGALAFIEKIPHLGFINLEDTSVTTQGIEHFLSTNKNINALAITGTPVSQQDLVWLKRKFPSIKFSDRQKIDPGSDGVL
jgi:serine/threonine protein kinase